MYFLRCCKQLPAAFARLISKGYNSGTLAVILRKLLSNFTFLRPAIFGGRMGNLTYLPKSERRKIPIGFKC